MVMYHCQTPLKWCPVVLATRVFTVLGSCGLLASVVALNLRKDQFHFWSCMIDTRGSNRCVCFPTIPLMKRSCFHSISVSSLRPQSSPKQSSLTYMADWHKPTSDPSYRLTSYVPTGSDIPTKLVS
jgi:hypothetical protein